MLSRNLWIAAAAIVAITAAAGALNYVKGRFCAQASEAITRRLRDRLFEHLQRLPCSYHDRADTGDLVQRCTSDVETVRSFLAVQVVEIARAILMVLTVLPFMLALSPRITLMALALVPLIVGFSVIFLRRVTTAFRKSDEAEARMTTVLQENLTGIRVVRAFARQDFECSKFGDANASFLTTTVRMIDLMAWYWSCSDYTCHLQMALVLVMGGFWVMQGQADVGALSAFLAYEGMLIWPIRQMGRLLTEVGKTMVSTGRLMEILTTPNEYGLPAQEAAGFGFRVSGSGPGATTAPPTERLPDRSQNLDRAIGLRPPVPNPETRNPKPDPLGAISFRDVCFSYDAKRPVLRGVTFDVLPGQTVAILGPSGAGKSTLMQLLLRLYPYEQGSIAIDGQELRTMTLHDVRVRAGVVLQEPFLYSKTLRENILVAQPFQAVTAQAGKPVLPKAPHSDDGLLEATSAADIHESIMDFENGYDTLVGERGVTLSGGQRQRVALARAILKKPPILILDDALSAVDTRTESTILAALRNRRGKFTTLVIAHRLSTLMQADRIIVMEHGQVVQSGPHQALIAVEGLYRRLWTIQTALAQDLQDEQRAASRGMGVPPMSSTTADPSTADPSVSPLGERGEQTHGQDAHATGGPNA
jgi:ATP-binding cassette subfamily B protein